MAKSGPAMREPIRIIDEAPTREDRAVLERAIGGFNAHRAGWRGPH